MPQQKSPPWFPTTIKAKLIAFSVGISALLLALALVFNWQTQSFHKLLDESEAKATKLLFMLDTARTTQVDFKKQVQEWKNTLLRGNSSVHFDEFLARFKQQHKLVQDGLASLEKEFESLGLSTNALRQLKAEHQSLEQKYLTALESYDQDDMSSAYRVDKLVTGIDRRPTDEIDALVDQITSYKTEYLNSLLSNTYEKTSQQLYTILSIIALTSIAFVFLSWRLIGNISRTSNRTLDIISKISDGSLSLEVENRPRDEFGQIIEQLSHMTRKMAGSINTIESSGLSIEKSGQELANHNQQLRLRTEDQASSLDMAAGAIQQFTSSVQHNVDRARQANQASQSAFEAVQQSTKLVNNVVSAMQGINESSLKISSIISIIDEIAFQTNLLALNAAVEAARAGDQGKGFAVVATEVRNLAQRSSTSAGEIKELIEASVSEVAEGTKIANESEDSLKDVVEKIQAASELVDGIVANGAEQEHAIAAIRSSLEQLDNMTKENKELVAHISGFSDTLQQQTQSLVAAIEFFHTDSSAAAPHREPVGMSHRLRAIPG